jgi:hypothetical protein
MMLSKDNVTFLKQVFVRLRALDYCVLRNYHTLPISLGKDIDILISFDDVVDAVKLVKSMALARHYRFSTLANEFNGFNVIVEADDQQINIHFQLWVSFETHIIYQYIPGLSEKIIKTQVASKEIIINDCIIKIPKELDELLLLLRQLAYKKKHSYEQRIVNLVSNSDSQIVNDAMASLSLKGDKWIKVSVNRTKLISELIWKVWSKNSLKNFLQATIYLIKRKY